MQLGVQVPDSFKRPPCLEIVWSRGFGLADVEGGRPATDMTSFFVGSVTKSVAAILLMQLGFSGRSGCAIRCLT